MALQRFTIDGYGQIEPNNVTFTRDGRIEAQCALASDDFVAENGMLLAVDVANMVVKAPGASETLPIAVHYSTEKIYNQQFSKKLPQSIQRIALRKLMMLDNAERLEDLRVPPANHLELLHGNRAGQYSIRINQQYRICFIFENGVSRNVEIVDYHS